LRTWRPGGLGRAGRSAGPAGQLHLPVAAYLLPDRRRQCARRRIWALDAGPNRSTAFHVVGAQFDTTYVEGTWLLRNNPSGGSQSLALGPSQGGFAELIFPEPGRYPFVSDLMIDAERGAHGTINLTR
jgi:nitrite reductase (NO-forming)